MEEGKVIFGVGLDTKSFEMQIKKTEDDLERLEEEYSLLEKGPDCAEKEETLKKLGAEIETAKNKLTGLKKEQAKIDNGIFDRMNNGLSKCVKTISHWALALVGIRSMYNAIRNATSTLSEYNDDLKNKLEGMKLVMATALEPLVTRIVDLAYKLMTYVNYIAKAWFNVDLFAKAGEKSMKKASKTMKDMSKTKASFDVFNTLGSKNSSKSSGEDVITFPKMEDVEVPRWIQWMADNKDVVIAALLGIAGGLTAVSFGLTAIQGFGIGIALAGIIFAIQNLIKFLQDPTFDNFTNIIIGIGIAILGVGIIIVDFPLIIAGAIATIVALIVKNYDFIIGLFDNLINWFENDFINTLHYLFGPIGDIIAQPFIFAINSIKGLFEGIFGGIKKIVNGIIQIFKGDFKNGIKNVFGGLKDILLAPINALISGINSLIRGVNKIKIDVPNWVPGLGGKKFGFNIPQIPKLAVGGIVNMPGRGVPVGGGKAVGGESGPEGVLPLTNNQQMEYLGQAIGKYVRIDNYIENNMDSKRINRVTKTSSSRRDFALNRG